MGPGTARRGLGDALVLTFACGSAACEPVDEAACPLLCESNVRMDIVLDTSARGALGGNAVLCRNGACSDIAWTRANGDPPRHEGASSAGAAVLRSLAPGVSLLSAWFPREPWDLQAQFRVMVLDASSRAHDYTRRVHGGVENCAHCTFAELRIEPGAAPEATCTSAPCPSGVLFEEIVDVPFEQMNGAELELCHNASCARAAISGLSESAPRGGSSRGLAGDLNGTLDVYRAGEGKGVDVRAHLPIAGVLLSATDVGRLTITAEDGTVISSGERTGFDPTQPNGAECTGPSAAG
jgi:hypothetical protein